jgi:hypothetical protein
MPLSSQPTTNRAQPRRLESERARLIECLAQVNEDRNQADLLEATLDRERALLRAKIAQLSEGEYRAAKVRLVSFWTLSSFVFVLRSSV